MPIRQPNGICTPTSSPASISDVAASTATVLPLRANVTVPPCAVRGRPGHREPLQVQPLGDARRRPHPLGRVEHALRPARPGLTVAPVGHLVVEPGQVEAALRRAWCAAAAGSRGCVRCQLGQLRGEHHVGFRWRGMQVDDIGDLVAPRPACAASTSPG